MTASSVRAQVSESSEQAGVSTAQAVSSELWATRPSLSSREVSGEPRGRSEASSRVRWASCNDIEVTFPHCLISPLYLITVREPRHRYRDVFFSC